MILVQSLCLILIEYLYLFYYSRVFTEPHLHYIPLFLLDLLLNFLPILFLIFFLLTPPAYLVVSIFIHYFFIFIMPSFNLCSLCVIYLFNFFPFHDIIILTHLIFSCTLFSSQLTLYHKQSYVSFYYSINFTILLINNYKL